MNLSTIFYTPTELSAETGKIDPYSLFLGVSVTFLALSFVAYGIWFWNGNPLLGAAVFFPVIGSVTLGIALFIQQLALNNKNLDNLIIEKKAKP